MRARRTSGSWRGYKDHWKGRDGSDHRHLHRAVAARPRQGRRRPDRQLRPGEREHRAGHSLAAARNPSYLATSASGENVYAVHETVTFDDQPGGGVTAYARDLRTGQLTALNARATLGDSPCHVTIDRSGRFLLNANYGVDAGSVTVHRIEPDGRLGNLTDHVEHVGSGPDPLPGRPTPTST